MEVDNAGYDGKELMSITGIPPELLIDLQETLLRCGPFDTDAELKNVFVDARIAPWRDRVPQAANGKATRVDALIEYLYDQFRDDTQENALALFLRVVGEALDKHDACHRQLIALAERLEILLASPEDTGMETHSSQRSQMGTNSSSFDQQGQHVDKQINVAGDYIGAPVLPAMSDGETHGPSPTIGNDTPPDLEFANRKYVLMVLTGIDMGPYHLIDAPAQYGKSKLLRQVQIRWQQKDGWTCARVCLHVEAAHTLPGLVQSLLSQFEVPTKYWKNLLATSDFGKAGRRLGEWLKADLDQKLSDNPAFKAGVVLLFDIDGNLPDALRAPLIIPLLNEFIPALQNALSKFPLSSEQRTQHILRVQVAGRYIGWLEKSITSLPLVPPHRLTPFNYKHVLEATSKYLGNDIEDLERIVSHLMYYTAGHPGCIAKILQSFKRSGESCESYFCSYRDEIWRMVDQEAYNVRQSIKPGTICTYVDNLSIFRYLDLGILSLWMEAEEPTHYELPYSDVYVLADALQDTQLMHYDKNNISILRDSIARGLLARHLLREKGPAAFGKRCKQARAICERYLQDQSAQLPALWVIEALFQSLQQHIAEIHDSQKRQALRQAFFEATLPQTLPLLIKNRQNPQGLIDGMRRALDIDKGAEEFRFTINYFLREDEYNDAPYRQLKEAVDRFFTQIQEGGR